MKTITSILIIVFVLIGDVLPQQRLEKQFKTFRNPDELVTLSQSLPFNEAIALLSKVSEMTTGKRIVSTVDSKDPIGIEIEGMPYDKALLVIVQYNGYIFEETEDVIIVKRPGEDKLKSLPEYASFDTREVKISAVFFEMNVSESKKRGIDWKILLSKGDWNVGAELFTQTTSQQQQQTRPPELNITSEASGKVGSFFGQATALFRWFEEQSLGEIIANPSVVVRDKNQGRIQVGSDFSVRTRDFAGNTVEKFFPTGTIIEVTPYIYNEKGIDYILLKILVERSSFSLNEQTTEIRKTNASTQILMLNGEETVLGGLFVNEETQTRNGIPFLKDLPGWFFGLRYLFGSDQTTVTKKELVILLKAELLPTLQERHNNPTSDNLILKERVDTNNRIKYYQLNGTESIENR
ncbi:Type IV pilus assembly protein PilQ [Ignavibacterium album JCM 16511]|uniref:Type IV pilus assembly protein PilQ n=1 Tax=Ignavibacterium album (strain DSM 19864 / JCM 16511 / NBRC 101810 / Mat9-16) TaxID=945713 RepID=I0AH15_IGNAJ|nr:type II and III secretion system protein [Ignavibacterium album]AFH48272.1 Type IV pilus assembly protein PilQ [Ignavibacterium album JCM 16511]